MEVVCNRKCKFWIEALKGFGMFYVTVGNCNLP